MSSNWIHPEQQFDVQLNVKVKIDSVGDWCCLGTPQDLQLKFDKMVKSGDVQKLIQKAILEDLIYGEGFQVDLGELDGVPMFDSFNFSVVEGN